MKNNNLHICSISVSIFLIIILFNFAGCKWFDPDDDDKDESNEETSSYTLTINSAGTGTGTTTPDVGVYEYEEGIVVDLSASPAASSVFSGWGGDVDAGGDTVTMDGNKTVTATFDLRTFTISATADENGSIDPVGSATVNYGSDETYTFTPEEGYQLDKVTVDGEETDVTEDSYTFLNVVVDHSISVTFRVLDKTWSKTYGHADWYTEYHTYGLDVTDDGGYVFAAEGVYNGEGGYDIWIVRIDSAGNVLWETGVGGIYGDYPEVVRQTSDGGFIVGGYTYSYCVGDSYCDAWVIKLSSSGDIEWQFIYGETKTDQAKDIIETFNDQGDSTGFLLCGYTNSYTATGDSDVWVVQLDTSGTVVKEFSFGGSEDEYGRAISITPDGGCIMTADTQSFGVDGRDIWVVKLDSDYSVEWEKTFGGIGDQFPHSVVCADDGGYVVGAYTDYFGAGKNDFLALGLDADGDIDWQYTYGGSDADVAQGLSKTDDGGYIMTGWTLSFDVDSFDAWVVKISETGLIQWQKSYNIVYDDGVDTWDGNERGYCVVQTADGGYAIAGGSYAFDERMYDAWICKVDSEGGLGCDMETDTDSIEDGSGVIAETDTSGGSTKCITDAVVNATSCLGYDTSPDVSTQCEVE